MLGTFILLLFGYFLAFVSYLAQLLYHRCFKSILRQ